MIADAVAPRRGSGDPSGLRPGGSWASGDFTEEGVCLCERGLRHNETGVSTSPRKHYHEIAYPCVRDKPRSEGLRRSDADTWSIHVAAGHQDRPWSEVCIDVTDDPETFRLHLTSRDLKSGVTCYGNHPIHRSSGDEHQLPG